MQPIKDTPVGTVVQMTGVVMRSNGSNVQVWFPDDTDRGTGTEWAITNSVTVETDVYPEEQRQALASLARRLLRKQADVVAEKA